MRNLVVLASGQGTNFEALALAERRGELGGRIVALLSDQPDAPAIARARRFGVEVVLPPAGRFKTRLEDERPWIAAVQERGADVLLLAGFMRRLHATALDAFPDRILNIHPSLLPAFPGLDAIRQAWDAGVHVSGCTVHLVDRELDAGPILAQAAVEVGDGVSLAAFTERIHAAEHRLYPATVSRYLTQGWRREGRRVVFDAAPHGGPGGMPPVRADRSHA